jgi:hypothetical protein
MRGRNIVRPFCSRLDTFRLFSPSADYLPIDARRTVAGSVHARTVSRALEVRMDSSRISIAQFPRCSMRMMTLRSLK